MSEAKSRGSRTWRQLFKDRQVLSWALNDWANSAFATTVMSGFFPVFFKKFWSVGADVNQSTYHLGLANSLSSGILACLAPILGAIADQGSGKKKALIVFSALGIIMTGALALVAEGDWQTAIFLYVLASIGFSGSNSFYDSLIVFVAPKKDFNHVSAFGFALGYLGGGVLFAINVMMTLRPSWFGLKDAAQAIQVSFVTVSIWWAVFTLPLIFFVHEKKRPSPRYFDLAKAGLRQVFQTLRELKNSRNIALFLIAYFFYIDGVNTLMQMAVDYGLSLGFPSESLIAALLLVQFVGFPAALVYGWLAHKTGPKAGIYFGIFVYMIVCVFAYGMSTPQHFYILAVVVGLVQGGLQALSRSVFAHMIPAESSGEYFGFFNMLGKFSSMVGPYLVGFVSLATRNSRLSIVSIVLLFLIGAIFLAFVRFPQSSADGD